MPGELDSLWWSKNESENSCLVSQCISKLLHDLDNLFGFF